MAELVFGFGFVRNSDCRDGVLLGLCRDIETLLGWQRDFGLSRFFWGDLVLVGFGSINPFFFFGSVLGFGRRKG